MALSKATLTSKWKEGSNKEQIVELVVTNNHDTNYLTWEDTLKISIDSQSLDTVTPGSLVRLAPGQSTIVQIGVTNKDNVAAGTQCDATATATWANGYSDGKSTGLDFSGSCGIGTYEASDSSLATHSSPDWFQQVKYGIFIHWGLYSVPAYGNGPGPDQDYAEW